MADETLNTHEPDLCCAKRLSKELRDGKLDGKNSWECPKCGVEWVCDLVGTFRHWRPNCPVMRF